MITNKYKMGNMSKMRNILKLCTLALTAQHTNTVDIPKLHDTPNEHGCFYHFKYVEGTFSIEKNETFELLEQMYEQSKYSIEDIKLIAFLRHELEKILEIDYKKGLENDFLLKFPKIEEVMGDGEWEEEVFLGHGYSKEEYRQTDIVCNVRDAISYMEYTKRIWGKIIKQEDEETAKEIKDSVKNTNHECELGQKTYLNLGAMLNSIGYGLRQRKEARMPGESTFLQRWYSGRHAYEDDKKSKVSIKLDNSKFIYQGIPTKDSGTDYEKKPIEYNNSTDLMYLSYFDANTKTDNLVWCGDERELKERTCKVVQYNSFPDLRNLDRIGPIFQYALALRYVHLDITSPDHLYWMRFAQDLEYVKLRVKESDHLTHLGLLKNTQYLGITNINVDEAIVLPEEIGTLSKLRCLHLSGVEGYPNQIHGIKGLREIKFVESEGKIDKSLSNLDKLVHLELSGKVELPETIELWELQSLVAPSADIEKMPKFICPELRYLDLGSARLEHALEPGAKLPIFAGGNEITSVSDLSECPELREVWVGNRINEVDVEVFKNCKKLMYIGLGVDFKYNIKQGLTEYVKKNELFLELLHPLNAGEKLQYSCKIPGEDGEWLKLKRYQENQKRNWVRNKNARYKHMAKILKENGQLK
ncbi:leucine-rich repeat domain-containing protein [Candidatus Nesciobacter abundans]|uniref:Leucine-rich repeat domain-containing protein n=1 Tax=Candidatus Nesciobacter abundans TaxID=2601668 RepID=A0A5C0UI90_9PROT|nr:hypothetical protein [Candidatus Nesciobacter abundans]QEK39301.1 hypothetical protein FZC36_02615 [Candidatus Nesciobacter abundans]